MSDQELEVIEVSEYAVIMTVRKFFWYGFQLGVVFTLILAGLCRFVGLV